MLLRTDDAAKLFCLDTPPTLDSPLSEPRVSSGIALSGKAQAKPCVGFAAVGSGTPGPRPTGMIGGAIRGAACRGFERPDSGEIGCPLGRRKLAAKETCDVFALS